MPQEDDTACPGAVEDRTAPRPQLLLPKSRLHWSKLHFYAEFILRKTLTLQQVAGRILCVHNMRRQAVYSRNCETLQCTVEKSVDEECVDVLRSAFTATLDLYRWSLRKHARLELYPTATEPPMRTMV